MGEIRISNDNSKKELLSYKNQIINLNLNIIVKDWNENSFRIEMEIMKKCLFNKTKSTYITLYESTNYEETKDLYKKIISNQKQNDKEQ